jgi:hypothetical protein
MTLAAAKANCATKGMRLPSIIESACMVHYRDRLPGGYRVDTYYFTAGATSTHKVVAIYSNGSMGMGAWDDALKLHSKCVK